MELKPLLEKIYYGSPLPLQNVMISMYGVHLKRQRYGGWARAYEEFLDATSAYTGGQMMDLQQNLFKRMVDHAFATVPFYREFSSRTGIGPKQIRGLEDLEKLPVVEKGWLRQNPAHFCSEPYLKRRGVFWLNTSGTTGSPLKILCDNEGRRLHYAFWSRLRRSAGLSRRSRRATFFGRIICLPGQQDPPFWRYDSVGRNMLFSSYHLADRNLPHYYSQLVAFRPEEVIGYPSSLYLLSRFINRNGLDRLSPKVVITTAETITQWQKEEIRKAFCDETVLIDQYGSTEMVHFVAQCSHGSYHVHPEHGVLEVKELGDGAAGEAICSGLVNYAMPLIRYRLGDALKMSGETCPCGSCFPVVSEIVGRVDDLLVTPDGRPLGRLDPIFKGMSGICETQIVQSSRDTFDINIVVDDGYTAASQQKLVEEIKKRTGEQAVININLMESIPKGDNGKFKSVISRVKQDNR